MDENEMCARLFIYFCFSSENRIQKLFHMGLFGKSESKSEALEKLDFPMFFGDYPFKEKKIVESRLLSSNGSFMRTNDALEDVINQAKERGFHAITHIQIKPNLSSGGSAGDTIWCNGIKLS